MLDLLSTRREPASLETLQHAAKQLERDIPDQLRSLLLRSDGGSVLSDAVLRVPDGSTAGSITVLPAEKLAEVTKRLLGLGSGYVAWARDGNGNALTIDQDSKVFFWDHDTDEHVPLNSTLEDVAGCFSRRARRVAPTESTTASAFATQIRDGASIDDLRSLLAQSMSEATVVAFLTEAVRSNRAELVELICQAGPVDQAVLGPVLVGAAANASIEVVESILRSGADIDSRHPRNEMTPLMGAASAGRIDMAQFLLDRGADRSIKTSRGRSAAQMAMTAARPELVKLLS